MPQPFKRFLENIKAHFNRRVPNTSKDWDSSIPHDNVRVADKGKSRAENTESERRLVVILELTHSVDDMLLNPQLMRKPVPFNPDLSRISEGMNTSLGFGYGSHFISTDFGGSSCLDGRPESGNRLHYTQQPNFSNRVDLCNSYGSIIDHRQNPYCDRNLHDSPGPSSFQEYAENPGQLNAGGVYTGAAVKPFNSRGTHPAPQKHSRHRD